MIMDNRSKDTTPFYWDDLAGLAHALYMIARANLSEERIAKISQPLLHEIAEIGQALVEEALSKQDDPSE